MPTSCRTNPYIDVRYEAQKISGYASFVISSINQTDKGQLYMRLRCSRCERRRSGAELHISETKELTIDKSHPQYYRMRVFLEDQYRLGVRCSEVSLCQDGERADPADFLIFSWLGYPYLLGEDKL